MLDKMGGVHAPKPSSGPHKHRESMPLIVILRNKLKYALTRKEAMTICVQKLVEVDGRVRTDMNFPVGLMDVVRMDRSGDIFRMMYDVKGRFVLHKIKPAEASFKLCKVVRQELTSKAVPYIATNDGRTIRYPDPDIKANDTVKVDLKTGKVVDFIKSDLGVTVFVTKGNNMGRVGTLTHIERHAGSYDIVNVRDAEGNTFSTRLSNVFPIGKSDKASDILISLPRDRGVRRTIFEQRDARLAASNQI
jgi:small subunit ribosomal protein S4e